MRNSFFFVRTCASSSLNAEIVICLFISLLYHTRRDLAPFSVRYCLRSSWLCIKLDELFSRFVQSIPCFVLTNLHNRVFYARIKL